MASDLEKQAKEAFIDDHFELAVDLYTKAIEISPKNADLYVDRAQANIKLSNFTEAVADANRAIELEPSNAKAYLRKGTACIKLEEFETAKAALEKGASLLPGDSRFTGLIKECDQRIAEENGDLRKLSLETSSSTNMPTEDVQPVEIVNEPPNQVTVTPAKPKYRHEFYQKPEEVVVTIFAKGVPADNVAVEFGEQILSVSIDVSGEGDAYHFQPRLFGKIIPEKCRYLVLSTKVEIHLAKAEVIRWTSLEFSKETAVTQRVSSSGRRAPELDSCAKFAVSVSERPTYPSSKPKRTDWDKLEAEVKKEEKEEKLDGDAALNKFFRGIYQDADEDTRRAMSKSFVESHGTVLSTNWKEVGTKKVEGSPPDGMELKKWEY
ncbi:N-terminal acetyltransferase A, auxiliary subunit [Parasponia andersonii]|uniref:Protein SGT1 homolog n=1 Tax=Parasponia andersonii TaxID=3476 RepID=A0A2P5CB04_PARAD|nr:N-terminal acetyltransferase A, auxiliary subunit [Parasponia andersonii]